MQDFTPFLSDRETLLAEVREHSEWIERCLGENPQDEWTPMFAVWSKPFDHPEEKPAVYMHCLAVEFNEADEKDLVMRRLAHSFYEQRRVLQMLVLSSEAWLSKRPPGAPDIEPRHDPQREEGLVVSGAALIAKGPNEPAMIYAHTYRPLLRAPDGHILPGTFGSVQTEGAHSNILDRFWRNFLREVMGKLHPRN